MADKYHVLYAVNMSLVVDKTLHNIPTADIVSISFMNQYDTMTHSMIRVRLYTDISLMRSLTSDPDNIRILCNMSGNLYQITQENDNLEKNIVKPVDPISFSLKCYIENKNIPTDKMDNYEDGIPVSSDLNHNVKIPIELYCYDETLIHSMQYKVRSIYKDMSMLSIINSMMEQCWIYDYSIEIPNNQKRYDQVLIPNLSLSDALVFLDRTYGLYTKGAQMFGEYDGFRICNSAVESITQTNTIPIYVQDQKINDDTSGMKKLGTNQYVCSTDASCVSVITESDIERVFNTKHVTDVNLNNLNIHVTDMEILFPNKEARVIETPDTLHKYANEYVSSMIAARIEEGVTRIDLSGIGFDIAKMNVTSRYSFIWQSPLRGTNTRTLYRTTYACHVLTNSKDGYFIANTTMNLCSNYK